MDDAMTNLDARDARTADEALLWTVDECCRYLRVGRTRLYASLKAGLFGPVPVKAFGRRLLFSRQEVIDWVEAGCPCRRAWQSTRGGGR